MHIILKSEVCWILPLMKPGICCCVRPLMWHPVPKHIYLSFPCFPSLGLLLWIFWVLLSAFNTSFTWVYTSFTAQTKETTDVCPRYLTNTSETSETACLTSAVKPVPTTLSQAWQQRGTSEWRPLWLLHVTGCLISTSQSCPWLSLSAPRLALLRWNRNKSHLAPPADNSYGAVLQT